MDFQQTLPWPEPGCYPRDVDLQRSRELLVADQKSGRPQAVRQVDSGSEATMAKLDDGDW